MRTGNGTVAVNTKSIAISNQIQYAVARLALKVQANTTNGKLNDSEGTAMPTTRIVLITSRLLVC